MSVQRRVRDVTYGVRPPGRECSYVFARTFGGERKLTFCTGRNHVRGLGFFYCLVFSALFYSFFACVSYLFSFCGAENKNCCFLLVVREIQG